MSTSPAKRQAGSASKKKPVAKQIKVGSGEQKARPPRRQPKEKPCEHWEREFRENYIPEDADPALKALNPYERCLKLSRGPIRQLLDFQKAIDQERDIDSMLQAIDTWIENGHLNALRKLVFLARESTKLLTKWAERFPDYVGIIAQDYSTWPLLCSTSTPHNKKALEILEKIGLDVNRPKGVPYSKLGEEPGGAKKWAADLLRRLDLTRRKRLGRSRVSHPILWTQYTDSDDWDLTYDHPEIATAAEHLPPLSKHTWEEWWKQGKELFLLMTKNEPWTDPTLSSYANSSKHKTEGSKRDAVLKQVRQAFEHLVGSMKSEN